jgi:hypothetical protein
MVYNTTMLKSAVLRHYKKVTAVAGALAITEAAVYAWPEVVPLESAQALEILTNGELPVDSRCYPKIHRAKKLVRAQARA